MLIIGSVLWRKPDKILKNVFLFKGIKNEVFPVKNLAFKIFIFILCKIHHFCQNFKKSCFILFIVCASVLSIVNSDCFIFDKVIRITVKVPSIRIALSI